MNERESKNHNSWHTQLIGIVLVVVIIIIIVIIIIRQTAHYQHPQYIYTDVASAREKLQIYKLPLLPTHTRHRSIAAEKLQASIRPKLHNLLRTVFYYGNH
jgi:uncharacterized membrane protein